MLEVDLAAAVRERMQAREQAAIDAGHPEWADLPMTRAEAIKAGVVRYYTGWACKHGHVAPRRRKGKACIVCDAASQVKWCKGAGREKHSEYMRVYMRGYRKQV